MISQALQIEEENGIDEVKKKVWEVGGAVQNGRIFYIDYAIRTNLAVPLSRVREAFQRLKNHVFCESDGIEKRFKGK